MRIFLFAALGLWLLGSAAGAQTLRIGLASEPTSIDPHFGNVSSNNGFAHHLFGTLVEVDANLVPQPGLAERWEVRNGTEWVFHLRPGVTFSDGTPFTARDVIFSLCRVLTVPTAAFATLVRPIETLSAPDPHTLVATTRAPYPLMALDLVGVNIISSRLVQGEPVYDPAHNCGATTPLPGPAEFASGQAVIGTGPYVLKSYARGDSAVLARNPRFWGPKAPWPEVLFKPVPNGAARVAGLLAGDFDLIENPPSTDLPRLRADTRFAVEMTPTPRIIYLQPDVGREPSPFVEAGGRNPLKDNRVRRAIALAIDRRALVEHVMDGAAVPAYQFLPDGMFGALEHAPEIPYDPATARRLLAEAGYPDGFGLTLHASNDRYVNDAKVAQAVGQYLTRIGIRTNVVTLPVSVFFTQRRELKYSLAQGGWNATSGEAISFLRNWAMTASTAEGFGGANYGGFSDPALDDLVRTALATIDDNARRTLLQQATARAIALLPEIPLYFESSSWAYRAGLSFKGRADQFTLATDVLPAR